MLLFSTGYLVVGVVFNRISRRFGLFSNDAADDDEGRVFNCITAGQMATDDDDDE